MLTLVGMLRFFGKVWCGVKNIWFLFSSGVLVMEKISQFIIPSGFPFLIPFFFFPLGATFWLFGFKSHHTIQKVGILIFLQLLLWRRKQKQFFVFPWLALIILMLLYGTKPIMADFLRKVAIGMLGSKGYRLAILKLLPIKEKMYGGLSYGIWSSLPRFVCSFGEQAGFSTLSLWIG